MNEFFSNSGKRFIILSKTGKNCVIQFIDTGYIRRANIDNIKAGKVKDLLAKSVYGVGYYGDFEKVYYWKKAKQLWQNMLKRCYCEKDSKGYFGRVTVADDWHCFSNFIRDLRNLKNFEEWVSYKSGGIKYNLDKDLLFPGCTVYSKYTCQFITEAENKSAGARNGKPFTKKSRVMVVE